MLTLAAIKENPEEIIRKLAKNISTARGDCQSFGFG